MRLKDGSKRPARTAWKSFGEVRQLLNELDDAIAEADLEAWDAPYRIEAPSFRNGSDRLRDALARFTT